MRKERELLHLLITLLIAILAYWILVPLAGLPVVVGAIAAVIIIIGGLVGID